MPPPPFPPAPKLAEQSAGMLKLITRPETGVKKNTSENKRNLRKTRRRRRAQKREQHTAERAKGPFGGVGAGTGTSAGGWGEGTTCHCPRATEADGMGRGAWHSLFFFLGEDPGQLEAAQESVVCSGPVLEGG